VVEDHPESEQALADSLSRLALRSKRADEVGDVRGSDRVDTPVAEQREEHPNGASVLEPRVLGDIDAAFLPATRCLAQRWRGDRLGGKAELRDALCGQLACDPAGANRRLALRGERPP
jgi:hypothetical protein